MCESMCCVCHQWNFWFLPGNFFVVHQTNKKDFFDAFPFVCCWKKTFFYGNKQIGLTIGIKLWRFGVHLCLSTSPFFAKLEMKWILFGIRVLCASIENKYIYGKKYIILNKQKKRKEKLLGAPIKSKYQAKPWIKTFFKLAMPIGRKLVHPTTQKQRQEKHFFVYDYCFWCILGVRATINMLLTILFKIVFCVSNLLWWDFFCFNFISPLFLSCFAYSLFTLRYFWLFQKTYAAVMYGCHVDNHTILYTQQIEIGLAYRTLNGWMFYVYVNFHIDNSFWINDRLLFVAYNNRH